MFSWRSDSAGEQRRAKRGRFFVERARLAGHCCVPPPGVGLTGLVLLCCRYQYPLQHMEGVPLPPGIPGLGGSTDPLEAVLGPFPCARLKNLPYDTSIEDILVLFQGLVVIDVVLVPQGDSFVIFANPMDFQMALQRYVRKDTRVTVEGLFGCSRPHACFPPSGTDRVLGAGSWTFRPPLGPTTTKRSQR